MKPLSYFAASSTQVAKHPVNILKLELRGGDSLAAARFFQIHDSASAPANGAVPVKSWPIYAAAPDYKEFKNGELHLANGLYVCVSTTEATKTLASGSDIYATLAVELDEAETPASTTFVGDLTTADEVLQVWAESAGPKKLIEIVTTNNNAATKYLQVHAADSPSTDSIVFSKAIAAGATKRLSFGKDGRDVRRIMSGAMKEGCTIAYSNAQGTYSAVGSADFNIQAERK